MSRRALTAVLVGGAVLLVLAIVGVVLATSGSSDALEIYSARSHYGEEQPFEDFAAETGTDLSLRGGDANELYERIRAEGANTPADVLITVDAANLWRATEDGLLDGTSEYNVSFVADRLAKDGPEATEAMLRSWMENDPEIVGSDVDVLDKIADGDCDVGLTNHYYLEREKEEDPDFPVEPVWADQDGRGTHVNLSGLGVVAGSDQSDDAQDLIEFLVSPGRQRVFSDNNHEFPVTGELEFKADPIDVEQAGARLDDAVNVMDEVGW